jgi:hypothetical protein
MKDISETAREFEASKAREDLLRRADAQGVKPFTSLADFMGDSEVIRYFDLGEFLRQVREDRDRWSERSAE